MKMENSLLTGRRSMKETFPCLPIFLWPPEYRSPFFPVFFCTGNRRYRKVPYTHHIDESRLIFDRSYPSVDQHSAQSHESSPEDLLVLTLAKKILTSGDELHCDSSTYFVTRPKSIAASVSGLLPTNIFTKKHDRDRDAPEHMEPTAPPEQTTDQSSLSARSHGPQPKDSTSCSNFRSRTDRQEFTPLITAEENHHTYSFQCSRPGLYQCSVTGLLFHMDSEGDVVYRTVPWNRRLLAQHHKKPAGPLFDIKCVQQQSLRQLHLPHCEIHSTGGCSFLSVAHVNDEGVEFLSPHKITETHVIVNITGFSGFGNVKDEDSAPVPVRAMVLLFYRPSTDTDLESLINVLLLPRNVVLRDVLRSRKNLAGHERYIETSPHCKLLPDQAYTLSTCPEDDSVEVQPTEAEFDSDNYDNFFPSFQVILEKVLKHIKLVLRDTSSSYSVWERRACLLSTGVQRSCGPSPLYLPSNERLLDIWSSFIDGISGPVLKSLLDKLFEKKVISDSERESADELQNKRDKARFIINTVRKKGDAASSEMIEFLCELDPFLCEHLGLI